MANHNPFSTSRLLDETNRAEMGKSANPLAKPPNFGPPTPNRKKRKPWLRLGGGALLLLILWNVYAFASYVAPWNTERSMASAEQDEIQQYIMQSEKSDETLDEASNSLIRLYDHNSLTELHIQEIEEKLKELTQQLETDDPRLAQLKSYHYAQIELVREMTAALQKSQGGEVHHKLDEILDRQKEQADDKAEILITLMEEENITYEQNADGTIAYE